MKAIVCEGAGQAVLLKNVDKPIAGSGQVVVKLEAAALNHRDLLIQSGRYVNLKYPIILGSDGAGTVDAVGKGVADISVGDKVIINPGCKWGEDNRFAAPAFTILGLPENGTFAEFVVVPQESIFVLPKHLSFEEAAALPLSGLTAYRALITRGQAKSGEKLLITGAGGGVATLLIQFATALGIKTFITSGSDDKIALAVDQGVEYGVNYKEDGWENSLKETAGGFDIIIDSAAGENFSKLVDLAKPGGRIVIHGATTGALPSIMPHSIFLKQLTILGSSMGSRTDFREMLELVEKYEIKPVIDAVFPLHQAEDALLKMASGAQNGKIVLKMSGNE